MSREILNLKQAAEHVHLSPTELLHYAQRGEVETERRGDAWYFEHRALDEWAQRNLLAANERGLNAQYRVMLDEDRQNHRASRTVAALFSAETTELDITAKTKAGVLRDMTDLAVRSGKVYDADVLYQELVAREAAASTAIGEGVALLHPRYHDPYLFEESFVAYGRSMRPIYFGATDGEATRHFFLICSTNHEEHLHILAQLAVLAHGTDLIAQLDEAEDVDAALGIVRASEAAYTA